MRVFLLLVGIVVMLLGRPAFWKLVSDSQPSGNSAVTAIAVALAVAPYSVTLLGITGGLHLCFRVGKHFYEIMNWTTDPTFDPEKLKDKIVEIAAEEFAGLVIEKLKK